MGLQEDMKLLGVQLEQIGNGHLVLQPFSKSFERIAEILKPEEKKEANWEKQKKELLKELGTGERKLESVEASVKGWEEQFSHCLTSFNARQEDIKRERINVKQISDKIDKQNEEITKYNDTSAAKKTGKRPLLVKPAISPLDEAQTKMEEIAKQLDDQKDVVGDIKKDLKGDEKRLKDSKAKLEKLKFPAKAGKK